MIEFWLRDGSHASIGAGNPTEGRTCRVAVVLGLGVAMSAGVRPSQITHAAAPIPKHLMTDPPAYYPTRVGTKWVYLRGNEEKTYVVTRAEVKGKEWIVVIDEVRPDGNKHNQTISVRPDGLYLVSELGNDYASPWCIVKLPHKKGETWNTPHGAMTSAGEECVKVPAGEFVAAPVEWDLGRGQKAIYWYAPGVGLVRLDVDGTPQLVLQSFTPGKE